MGRAAADLYHIAVHANIFQIRDMGEADKGAGIGQSRLEGRDQRLTTAQGLRLTIRKCLNGFVYAGGFYEIECVHLVISCR